MPERKTARSIENLKFALKGGLANFLGFELDKLQTMNSKIQI